jgi:predicted LPLAT superfamily acyltransferase
MADWRKVPEAGTVFGIRLLVLCVRIFGRRITGWILYVVAFYYALFHRTARRASRDYLRRIGEPAPVSSIGAGGTSVPRATFWTIVRHIQTFAQVSLDRLFFLTGRFGSFQFEQKNHDLLVQAAKSGRGVLLLGAHLGSFEVMRGRAKEFNVPINVVADFSNAERMNGVLRSLAPDIDTRLISLRPDPVTAMLAIRSAIDRGELVAILGDRTSDGESATKTARVVKSQFLGADAEFPAGPWLIAHALRCPVYFVAGIYTRPNHYALHFEFLADEVKLDRKDRETALVRYTQTYASMLETYARSAPLNWFNFFDFWKSS